MSLTSFAMPLKVAAAVCSRRVCGRTLPSSLNARHRSSIPTRSPSIKGTARTATPPSWRPSRKTRRLRLWRRGEKPPPRTPCPRRPAIEEHVRPQDVEQELRPEEGPRGSLCGTVLASLLGQPQRGAHEGVQQRPYGAEVVARRGKGGLSQRRVPLPETLARQEGTDPTCRLARHHRANKLGHRAPIGNPQLP